MSNMTTAMEYANFIHLHDVASAKLQSELRQHGNHLRQLLGHVSLLENMDLGQDNFANAAANKHSTSNTGRAAPPAPPTRPAPQPQQIRHQRRPAIAPEQAADIITSQNLSTFEPEPSPSVSVTECGEEDEDDSDATDDDAASLTSNSGDSDEESDEDDDTFFDFDDPENDAEHMLVRFPSRCLEGRCDGSGEGKNCVCSILEVVSEEKAVVKEAWHSPLMRTFPQVLQVQA